MTDFESRVRAAMKSAVADEQPPENLVRQVRRRHRRHTARAAAAGAAAVAAVAVLVPVGLRAAGNAPGPAEESSPGTGPTVYIDYPSPLPDCRPHCPSSNPPAKVHTILPIRVRTNTPGKPIRLRFYGETAITPDGKTLYAATSDAVVPISTATNKPGKPIPIHIGANHPVGIDVNPDGKTAYLTGFSGAIVPISIATNTASKPIHIGGGLEMALTPDGKTLYVAAPEGPPAVTPISTATNTPGQPIHIGGGVEMALTPDGKTLYAATLNEIVPISTATNTPGTPIRHAGYGYPSEIAITP